MENGMAAVLVPHLELGWTYVKHVWYDIYFCCVSLESTPGARVESHVAYLVLGRGGRGSPTSS